ncbi:hypothetical protein DPMN_097570 [Dreissena polymorpha]|uniref:Uncharacterized protein n=1 Tax=Dreissena polymorpha TaxID=45954 RepID=A0A9D4LBG9_DREPO|nr:hypothetical protein DPMN_097570 [Dreissena polymorpha]
MATTVSRSLPDGIGQGHRQMPDQLASALRSLTGDNAGHVMTGMSQGTGPVTRDRSGQRPVTSHRGPVRSPVRQTGQQRPIRSPVRPNGQRRPVQSPVQPTGQRRPVRSPVRPTSHLSNPLVNGDRSGHRSSVTDDPFDQPATGHLLLMTGRTHQSTVICYW